MDIDRQIILDQLNQVVNDNVYLTNIEMQPRGTNLGNVNFSQSLSLISLTVNRFSPSNSPFKAYVDKIINSCTWENYSSIKHSAKAAYGVLLSLKTAYERDYIDTVENLIQADIFDDFMDMANHLLKEGYHIAAAVIIGGVLEEKLRKLCLQNGLPITKENHDGIEVSLNGGKLNQDLQKAEVYTSTEAKQIVYWQDLRNNAAHGNYDKFKKPDIDLMYQGVLHFLSKFSAT